MLRQCKEQIRRAYNGQMEYMEMDGETMHTPAVGSSLVMELRVNVDEVKKKMDLLMAAYGLKMIDLQKDHMEEMLQVVMMMDAVNDMITPSMETIADHMQDGDEGLKSWLYGHCNHGVSCVSGIEAMLPKLSSHLETKEEA